MERNEDRNHNQLREISIETDINIHAEGSALISFGNTKVICNASIENNVPRWMRNSNEGWVTGDYGMVPRSTNERMGREAARGKQSGRTQEIQRLIGRSLRQAVNLKYLKGKTINVDCDVIQADGGTRTASITGGCVALFLAIKNHHDDQRAIKSFVAAVSMGIKDNKIIARTVNKEKNNFALKIIPELINLDPRLGNSGSFIELNQIFEKKNAIETPNKIKIVKINKYE